MFRLKRKQTKTGRTEPRTSRDTGQDAEQLACDYLQQQGLKLIQRNYHCRYGEIDLIMEHQGTVVLVEVRYRNDNRYGGAKASITPKKIQKLQATALHYMQRHRLQADMRFDVVAITGTPEIHIEWIRNAIS